MPKSSFITTFLNGCTFIFQFFKSPSTVGAILPGSRNLAREISSEIPNDPHSKKRLILEIGPSVGNFSDKIISKMNSKDELHLVECNEQFCKKLIAKYSHIPNITVFHRSILDHTPPKGAKYDFVVSGLPLNAFKASFVKSVLDKFVEMTHNESKISYFEYLWLPHLALPFAKTVNKDNVKKILELKSQFYDKYSLRTSCIFLNIPPARVIHHVVRTLEEK